MKKFILVLFSLLIAFSFSEKVKAQNSPEYYKRDVDNSYLNLTNVRDLWSQGYTGKNVNVAVIDTGVDTQHPALKDKLVQSVTCLNGNPCVKDEIGTDDQIHGTHIAGIISGTNNGVTNGIAPNAKIYSFKAAYEDINNVGTKTFGVFNPDDLIHVLTYIKEMNDDDNPYNNISFVNMSFGAGFTAEKTNILTNLIKEISKGSSENPNGTIFVTSAGNDGPGWLLDTARGFPKNVEGVLTISNLDGVSYQKNETFNLDKTSSFGINVDFSAPGTGVLSSIPVEKDSSEFLTTCPKNPDETFVSWCLNSEGFIFRNYTEWDGTSNGYLPMTGTSMAAPVVVGILTLLKEKYPKANMDQLKDYLKFMAYYIPGTTNNYSLEKKTIEYGYGLIQAEIGEEVNRNIKLYKQTDIYNLPNTNYYTGTSLAPQTVTVVREGEKGTLLEGWYEIKTWLGYRWIKPSEYEELINQKITVFSNTTLYSDKNKTTSYGSITPQTVTAVKKSGNWFEVNTYLGPKWIKPSSYTIGNFNLALNNQETLYATKNGSSTGARVSPQTVNVISRSNDWFQINSYLGDMWIKPTNYEQQFNVTLNGVYNLYSSINGSKIEAQAGYHSYPVTTSLDGWFQIPYGSSKSWIKPLNYFSGEYNLKLNQDLTYLYNGTDSSQTPVGKLAPQTVVVVERKKKTDGYWFLIKTSIGLKWCKPDKSSFSEYQ